MRLIVNQQLVLLDVSKSPGSDRFTHVEPGEYSVQIVTNPFQPNGCNGYPKWLILTGGKFKGRRVGARLDELEKWATVIVRVIVRLGRDETEEREKRRVELVD